MTLRIGSPYPDLRSNETLDRDSTEDVSTGWVETLRVKLPGRQCCSADAA